MSRVERRVHCVLDSYLCDVDTTYIDTGVGSGGAPGAGAPP